MQHPYTATLTAPPPAPPVNVTAVQIGDRFKVTWSPGDPSGPALTGNVVTATPQDSSAPVLITRASASATTAYMGPLQPSTTYALTVTSLDAGGPGAPSTVDETVPEATRSVALAITDTWTWAVSVRAHDAAGWGPMDGAADGVRRVAV